MALSSKRRKNPSRYHNHRCAIGKPEKEAEDVEIVLTNAREEEKSEKELQF